jgi:hypothetical protein
MKNFIAPFAAGAAKRRATLGRSPQPAVALPQIARVRRQGRFRPITCTAAMEAARVDTPRDIHSQGTSGHLPREQQTGNTDR